jgi:hypothetical protein
MISTYYQLLKKTWAVVRRDPIVLAPYMIVCMAFFLMTPMVSLNNSKSFIVILEGCFLFLFIHPFVVSFSLSVIQKKNVAIATHITSLLRYMPFFLIMTVIVHASSLFAGYKLSAIQLTPSMSFNDIPKNDMFIIFICFVFGIIMATLTCYFYPIFFTQSKNNTPTVWGLILQSIRFFWRFKWITLMAMLYFFLTVTMFKLFILQLSLVIIPAGGNELVIYLLHALEQTFFYIMMLRLYLYLRPLANLDDN